ACDDNYRKLYVEEKQTTIANDIVNVSSPNFYVNNFPLCPISLNAQFDSGSGGRQIGNLLLQVITPDNACNYWKFPFGVIARYVTFNWDTDATPNAPVYLHLGIEVVPGVTPNLTFAKATIPMPDSNYYSSKVLTGRFSILSVPINDVFEIKFRFSSSPTWDVTSTTNTVSWGPEGNFCFYFSQI
ncbi:MAG: hypothetical protein ACO3UU_06690, partial [Minisyncoccia bacterium]